MASPVGADGAEAPRAGSRGAALIPDPPTGFTEKLRRVSARVFWKITWLASGLGLFLEKALF
jgi:hypothetical protein